MMTTMTQIALLLLSISSLTQTLLINKLLSDSYGRSDKRRIGFGKDGE